jgi:large subunit ribosomal protein L29
MKPNEIREMSPDEMGQKIKDLKQELFNLRFQHEVGQLENSARLTQTRKDIARVQTVLRNLELQQKEA